MSIVGTWVYCNNGLWHLDPVWRAADNSWFVCVDDDDPPELVVQETLYRAAGWPELPWFAPRGRIYRGASRVFVPPMHFERAVAVFGELTTAPPIPQTDHDRRADPEWPPPVFGIACVVQLNTKQQARRSSHAQS